MADQDQTEKQKPTYTSVPGSTDEEEMVKRLFRALKGREPTDQEMVQARATLK